MKVVHGMRPEEHETPIVEAQDFKICPICGATCFSDMEVCFGCLHHFEGDESLPTDQTPSDIHEQQEVPCAEQRMKAKSDPCSNEAFALSAADEPQETKETNETPLTPFDHMRDIPGLKKPEALRSCSPRAHCKSAQEDAMTSHHICSDGEGRQFEISITVKLL